MMLRESMVVGLALVIYCLQHSAAEECIDLKLSCPELKSRCSSDDQAIKEEIEWICPQTCGLCEVAPVGCPTTKTQVPEDPNHVCLDMNANGGLCSKQKITFTGKTCPSADRITIWFFVDQYPQANPQFDARFGFGGHYRYQANNRMASGYGVRQTFDTAMELIPNQDFVMEFEVRSETSIEWKIDGNSIGTYRLRENGKVADIHKICLENCALISSVKLSSA